ncbi:10967_t:CDS:2 [Cetraspora pellucida]|uniref:10967_t:CDS:1 n=1 Tax=Cetraspora pellucida TaxID=1433469 RepID=A0A9N9BLD2_9GLOM|nr:10967_t:CDS:2 [Cetraspora pellucida]
MSFSTYQVEINEKKDPDSFITLSSKLKGNELEFIAFRILKNTKIDCQKVRLSGSNDDGGIDIFGNFGNFEGYLILVQYKNYTDAKIVLMILENSKNTINRAETSEFNILLTNVSSMKLDIINYVIEN